MSAPEHADLPDRRMRQFGLLLAAIVAAVFGLAMPLLASSGWRPWPWLVAVLLALPALFAPGLLRPVYRGWMRFGTALGWVNTRALLLVVFCALIVPIGLIMRLAGRDPMERRIDKSRKTYRVPSRDADPRHMNAPY